MNNDQLTTKQKQTLSLLLKFRFTTVYHLQKYYNYKDPRRVRDWLEDLRKKKYIDKITNKDITKPIVYCLAQRSRNYFMGNKNIDQSFLDRLYKENKRSELFRKRWHSLFDAFLFFYTNKDKDSKLTFSTEQELINFDYFPKDLNAYMAVESKGKTKRYFLEVFDEYHNKESTGSIDYTVRKYRDYFEDGDWQANTNNSPFPSVLLILPNERKKWHVHYYGGAVLAKTFENISIYVTTQDMIKFAKKGQNIWQKVKEKDL